MLSSGLKMAPPRRSITGMISLPSCAVEATSRLPDLLNHRFPTVRLLRVLLLLWNPYEGFLTMLSLSQVRSATAEQLYMVLQTVDFPNTDEIEDVLLSTNWSVIDQHELLSFLLSADIVSSYFQDIRGH